MKISIVDTPWFEVWKVPTKHQDTRHLHCLSWNIIDDLYDSWCCKGSFLVQFISMNYDDFSKSANGATKSNSVMSRELLTRKFSCGKKILEINATKLEKKDVFFLLLFEFHFCLFYFIFCFAYDFYLQTSNKMNFFLLYFHIMLLHYKKLWFFFLLNIVLQHSIPLNLFYSLNDLLWIWITK